MCELTLSAEKVGCKTAGGIESFYLVDKRARVDASIAYSVTAGAVTITGTGASAYHFIPNQNSFGFTQPTTSENDSNSFYFTQTLEGVLHGYSAAKVALIEEMAKGRMEVLIKMVNGTYVMAGIEDVGLQISGGDGGATGQAIGDANGMTITMSGQSTTLAPILADYAEFSTAFTVVEPS